VIDPAGLSDITAKRVTTINGFDCVLRVGKLDESGLVARRLGEMPMMNCASPAYLKKRGTPRTLDDLDDHLVVYYSVRFGTDAPGFEYRDGNVYRERPMRSVITVNSTDSYRAACLAGLGIIQAPRMGLLPSVAAGELVAAHVRAAAGLARARPRPQRAAPRPGRNGLDRGDLQDGARLNGQAVRGAGWVWGR